MGPTVIASEKLKILLVEDDRGDYLLTTDLLNRISSLSTEVTWAQNLSTAQKLCEDEKFSLALVDCHLAGESGLDFLRWVQNSVLRIPVLFLTGENDLGMDLEALRFGAADYLVKGQITSDQLARAIRYALVHEHQLKDLEVIQSHLEEKVRERTRDLESVNERLEDMNRKLSREVEEKQKLYEVAQRANRLKDQFLSTLSHELRSPLNVIGGYSEVLMGADLEASEAQEALAAIQRGVRQQTQLINDLLDVSRIVTGKMSVQVKMVQIAEVIRQAHESVRFAAEVRRVDFEFIFPHDIQSFRGDPDRLQQVFWNLFSNAIKFSPSGSRVRVEVSSDGDSLAVLVRDHGLGIPADFIPFVFERFRQEDPSVTRSHGGLGLGLAIARHIVELHGGSIEVQSEGRNQGASFVVRLPLSHLHSPQSKSSQIG